MSAEIARFQNFAKLKDTEVAFNDITVLAGKPGTGKSYVMKSAYGIYEVYETMFKSSSRENELFEKLNFNNIKIELPHSMTDKFNEDFQELVKNLFNSIFYNLEQISNEFSMTFHDVSVSYKNEKLSVSKDSTFLNGEEMSIKGVMFVETPLILEFHKHLDRRKAKTPYHIESLISILDEDYSFTNEEQDALIKSFSKKVNSIIGGDIKNRNGSFVFSRNDDKDYNIFNASSGIKSIGLLQYLVTNKALKKGSVLFWEEPEVHLHPEWQLKMVELFVELMNAGVKIIFSTHSTFMADSLNALAKRNKFSDRVSFNLFKEYDGVVENHILESDEKWKMIQDELLKSSLQEIMWQYL